MTKNEIKNTREHKKEVKSKMWGELFVGWWGRVGALLSHLTFFFYQMQMYLAKKICYMHQSP